MNAKSDVKHESIAKDMEITLAKAEEEEKAENKASKTGFGNQSSDTPKYKNSLIKPEDIETFKRKSRTMLAAW